MKSYFNRYLGMKSAINLSFTIAVYNFKVRNEGSYFGIAWYLLEPLASFIVLLFVGGALYQNSIQEYPAYLLLGLIMFNFFLSVTNNSSAIITRNKHFIKSIKINSVVFIIANMWQGIFSHIFEVILFAALMVYLKMSLAYILIYPVIFLALCLFTIGISFIFATVGMYIVDWENIWQVGGRLLWFATPIFYFIGDTSSLIGKINYYNPLSRIIGTSREIILYGQIPTFNSIVVISIISLATALIGLYIFNIKKNMFAERI